MARHPQKACTKGSPIARPACPPTPPESRAGRTADLPARRHWHPVQTPVHASLHHSPVIRHAPQPSKPGGSLGAGGRREPGKPLPTSMPARARLPHANQLTDSESAMLLPAISLPSTQTKACDPQQVGPHPSVRQKKRRHLKAVHAATMWARLRARARQRQKQLARDPKAGLGPSMRAGAAAKAAPGSPPVTPDRRRKGWQPQRPATTATRSAHRPQETRTPSICTYGSPGMLLLATPIMGSASGTSQRIQNRCTAPPNVHCSPKSCRNPGEPALASSALAPA